MPVGHNQRPHYILWNLQAGSTSHVRWRYI